MAQSFLTMDFGTSNSLVGAVINGKNHLALPLDPSAPEPTVIRTLLFFPHQNQAFYGQEAILEYEKSCFEGRFIKSIKKFLPAESFIGTYIEDRVVRIEDLIGYFLLEMKRRAEKLLDHKFDSIVLGRPAKYSHVTSKDNVAVYRMKKAAEFAGFKSVEFVPEPLAAAYDFRSQLDSTKLVLVVDLGGGTSDFTIVKMNPDSFSREDVLGITGVAIAGDKYDGSIMAHKMAPYLGSEVSYKAPLGSNLLTMPKSLLDHICSPGDLTQMRKKDFYQFFLELKNWNVSPEDKDLLSNLETIVEDNLGFKVFEAIEASKVDVNKNKKTVLHYRYADLLIEELLTLQEFEELSMNNTNKIFNELNECLNLAQVTADDIDYIHCTGGTSKLNIVQTELERLFSPDKIQTGNEFSSVLSGLNEYCLSEHF